MKEYEENMKELFSRYIDHETWKNFKLVSLGGGGDFRKIRVRGGGNEGNMDPGAFQIIHQA